jgi:hypothetical protein
MPRPFQATKEETTTSAAVLFVCFAQSLSSIELNSSAIQSRPAGPDLRSAFNFQFGWRSRFPLVLLSG